MLMREAEAWHALLALHSSVLRTASGLASEEESGALYAEKQLNSESREAAYCAALSGLANSCDSLYNEAIKLRTFRKARRQVETQVREVVRGHADETMAVGQTLAQNGALGVASVTADLRVAIQAQRNQVAQLRALLEATKAAGELPLPRGATIVVGISGPDNKQSDLVSIEKLLASVFEASRELSEASVCAALLRLLRPGEGTREPAARHFARRERRSDSAINCAPDVAENP
jgi:hypothetical protein